MQKVLRQPINKSTVLKVVSIFLVSYVIALFLWIQARDTYCYTVALVTSKIVGGLNSARLEDIITDRDMVVVTFRPFVSGRDVLAHISIPTNYTFNAPLTIAIMASMYLFITRRRRAYTEALLILLGVHFLYVFSFEMKDVTEAFMNMGIRRMNKPVAYTYQFLWVFTRSMIIRFEPFLIGFYMYFRFSPRFSRAKQSK
jgi:ABC-type Fe3+-siderophore transport system permease subunit